ncbi:MAG TPA: hypothetical protein VHZ07_24430 [Bryobacteraceae bacterium]|jgi:hypothetical protein|nr:hypothetical protein [Bryobacteraceae bacterium]
MSARSIRRAAERKALKDARKRGSQAVPGQPVTENPQASAPALPPLTQKDARLAVPVPDVKPPAQPAPTVSEARLAANAANAQLSTGPRTPEGKAKSSINAVKTALTGRTVLLPSDDVAAYRKHVQVFTDEFQPVGPSESKLVQALADHDWRLDRIACLEMAIYARGHEQFAGQFADRGALQAGFTEMHTFLHYEKQLRNLQIQEMRIRRNREKDTAELRGLQHERARAASVRKPVLPASPGRAVGFDFSLSREYPEIPVSATLNAPQARTPAEKLTVDRSSLG